MLPYIVGGIVLYSLYASAKGGTPMADTKDTLVWIAKRIGAEFNLPPSLLMAIAQKESDLNPKAVSPNNSNGTRDYGLMQINTSNFNSLGLDFVNVFDPITNMRAAGKLLAEMRNALILAKGRADESELISSYNQGVSAFLQYGMRNLAYVISVNYWKLIYKLRGLA